MREVGRTVKNGKMGLNVVAAATVCVDVYAGIWAESLEKGHAGYNERVGVLVVLLLSERTVMQVVEKIN